MTGLVDLEGGWLLDLVADCTRAAVDGWLGARTNDWLAGVGTVALDAWRGYASALVASLGHARVVVDHFHAVRLANTVVDQVRRRLQQATLAIAAASVIRCTGSVSLRCQVADAPHRRTAKSPITFRGVVPGSGGGKGRRPRDAANPSISARIGRSPWTR